MKHLPVFRNILSKAGFRLPEDRSIKINPIFNARDFELNSRLCFVLMPFSANWSDRIYNKVLKPILEDCGLEVKRADNFFGHDILEDIWSAINSAFIIVADVTGRNANVFYELGLAHTLGKNVILLTQDRNDVPFDIQQFRCIAYADNKDGYEMLEELLPKYVERFYSPSQKTVLSPGPNKRFDRSRADEFRMVLQVFGARPGQSERWASGLKPQTIIGIMPSDVL